MIHQNFDVVALSLAQFQRGHKRAKRSVNARLGIAFFQNFLKKFLEFSLAAPHHRRENLDFTGRELAEDFFHDLLAGLAAELEAAAVAVRRARLRVKEPEIIENFRDGGDRRARVVGDGALFNRN